jgi:uncharacterized protein (DUF4213/DUF364 family)
MTRIASKKKGAGLTLEEALLESISSRKDPVNRVCIGLHWTAVESRNVGMAHTYKTARKVEIDNCGELVGMDAASMAHRILSWEPLEASLGTAALNSLLEPAGETGSVNDIIMDKARGRTVTVIGRFPFNADVNRVAKKAYLLEMEPEKGELPSHAAERVIPESELAVISATALINHSLQRLLELASDSYTIVLGPSTPLSKVLFGYGVDVLAGVRVSDPDALFSSLSQGAKSFDNIGGIEPVCLFAD